ncbi:hypothetical protein BQ8482_520002 [Mesorhizobium delmotii]|uniref:Transcription regulator AsnC/Lrp ligand binding domain-containing protein n=1 Tax=Mesorhizobium delmotii TaxID=1631247 RepID=A0A2P9AUN8_9HYPH|nr:hypothetical protein BQ8482_520002 [Mesorhizobium delmotii]
MRTSRWWIRKLSANRSPLLSRLSWTMSALTSSTISSARCARPKRLPSATWLLGDAYFVLIVAVEDVEGFDVFVKTKLIPTPMSENSRP